MQALGAYAGGRMLFLGLGTGLGSALIADGMLMPLELAHLPYRRGRSYEDYVGTRALERLGRGAESVAALKEAVRCSSNSPVMLAGLGHAFAALQDRREARRVADELERLRADKGLFAYELAVIHGTLGDHDRAFSWFESAIRERSGWIAYLHVDPRLDSLHADPRFDSLAANSATMAQRKRPSRGLRSATGANDSR